jgi:hypothetical protein
MHRRCEEELSLVCLSRIIPASVALAGVLAAVSAEPVTAQPGSGGAMGAVARGTVAISLSVAPRVQADRLASENIASTSQGTGQSEPFCIWSNASIGTYSLSAAAALEQSDAPPSSSAAPSYLIEWSDVPGASSGAPREHGTLAGLRAQTRAACGSSSRPASILVVRTTKPYPSAAQGSAAVQLVIAPD